MTEIKFDCLRTAHNRYFIVKQIIYSFIVCCNIQHKIWLCSVNKVSGEILQKSTKIKNILSAFILKRTYSGFFFLFITHSMKSYRNYMDNCMMCEKLHVCNMQNLYYYFLVWPLVLSANRIILYHKIIPF